MERHRTTHRNTVYDAARLTTKEETMTEQTSPHHSTPDQTAPHRDDPESKIYQKSEIKDAAAASNKYLFFCEILSNESA
jgi:hypothetical protein